MNSTPIRIYIQRRTLPFILRFLAMSSVVAILILPLRIEFTVYSIEQAIYSEENLALHTKGFRFVQCCSPSHLTP